MILLIDDRSGSGKTTFSAKLHSTLGRLVIHLEDVYPGWSGLQKASTAVAETILNPVLPAEERGYRRWDWYASEFAEWVQTSPGSSLIVEGYGTVTEANLAAARAIGDGNVWGIWVELDTQTRFARAMVRDDHSEEHQGVWAEQESQHMAKYDPQQLVDWIISVPEQLTWKH